MSLPTNYTEWLPFLRDFLDVDDYTDAQINSFLGLAQITLNRDLNSQWMEKETDLTVTAAGTPLDLATLVIDYNRVRLVNMKGGKSLIAKVKNEMRDLLATNSEGSSVWYSIDERKLTIYPWPAQDSIVQFSYYQMVPMLSATVDTNTFSQYHPDAILYAACVAASPYMAEDERVPVWAQQYEKVKTDINRAAGNSKHGSVPLKRQITLVPT